MKIVQGKKNHTECPQDEDEECSQDEERDLEAGNPLEETDLAHERSQRMLNNVNDTSND